MVGRRQLTGGSLLVVGGSFRDTVYRLQLPGYIYRFTADNLAAVLSLQRAVTFSPVTVWKFRLGGTQWLCGLWRIIVACGCVALLPYPCGGDGLLNGQVSSSSVTEAAYLYTWSFLLRTRELLDKCASVEVIGVVEPLRCDDSGSFQTVSEWTMRQCAALA